MADAHKHFCTCTDTECPLNPNNPKHAEVDFGCDACIRKNLALGEIPTCMFVACGDASGWDDWSREGFARFVAMHPRKAEEIEAAKLKAQAFEITYKHNEA